MLSTNENGIKLSDGNYLQDYDLRPINYTYLDSEGIDDEEVLTAIVNFSNEEHRYAHILQNRIRRINAGIDIPLCDATLAKDGITYLNIYN